MKFKLIITVPLILIAAVTFSNCKKKKPDPAKYAEICAEVVKCDPVFKGNALVGQQACQAALAGLEGKMPALMPQTMDCLNKQPCEKKSFTICAQGAMSQMGSIPGLQQ